MIVCERNLIVQGMHGRPFLADVYYRPDGKPKPVVIFSHGFKGFKDWGAYHEVAELFAAAGFMFLKFNFSHNGTTIDHPMDFADLEAFGNDNLTIEMDDLGVTIDWLFSEDFPMEENECDKEEIYLLGHSRGGGISILKAREDKRVKKLCTWGSVNEFSKYWTEEELAKIKEDGVVYLPNSRTKQMMPIKWQMYENYFANLGRLFVPDAVKQLNIPFLIIHGTKDETIPVDVAKEMSEWNDKAQLLLIENGNHNFGGRHPWKEEELPEHLQFACEASIQFFNA